MASKSPRRRELLALLELPFQTVGAQVDESIVGGESPADTALRLALAKACAVALLRPKALVLGCDTIVALEGRILGKPADEAEARVMLRRLRNHSHAVYTGIAAVGNGQQVTEAVESLVIMRDYTNMEMDAYIASGDPMDKAGAYAIQHPAFRPVASWEGCYANVMGLPLCHLVRAFLVWDITPAVDIPAACQVHTGERCEVFPEILTL